MEQRCVMTVFERRYQSPIQYVAHGRGTPTSDEGSLLVFGPVVTRDRRESCL
jgi:hypothetical protein